MAESSEPKLLSPEDAVRNLFFDPRMFWLLELITKAMRPQFRLDAFEDNGLIEKLYCGAVRNDTDHEYDWTRLGVTPAWLIQLEIRARLIAEAAPGPERQREVTNVVLGAAHLLSTKASLKDMVYSILDHFTHDELFELRRKGIKTTNEHESSALSAYLDPRIATAERAIAQVAADYLEDANKQWPRDLSTMVGSYLSTLVGPQTPIHSPPRPTLVLE